MQRDVTDRVTVRVRQPKKPVNMLAEKSVNRRNARERVRQGVISTFREFSKCGNETQGYGRGTVYFPAFSSASASNRTTSAA